MFIQFKVFFSFIKLCFSRPVFLLLLLPTDGEKKIRINLIFNIEILFLNKVIKFDLPREPAPVRNQACRALNLSPEVLWPADARYVQSYRLSSGEQYRQKRNMERKEVKKKKQNKNNERLTRKSGRCSRCKAQQEARRQEEYIERCN